MNQHRVLAALTAAALAWFVGAWTAAKECARQKRAAVASAERRR